MVSKRVLPKAKDKERCQTIRRGVSWSTGAFQAASCLRKVDVCTEWQRTAFPTCLRHNGSYFRFGNKCPRKSVHQFDELYKMHITIIMLRAMSYKLPTNIDDMFNSAQDIPSNMLEIMLQLSDVLSLLEPCWQSVPTRCPVCLLRAPTTETPSYSLHVFFTTRINAYTHSLPPMCLSSCRQALTSLSRSSDLVIQVHKWMCQ